MIQCKKNLTLFPELQPSIAKNSVLSLSKYSIPKSAYKVGYDQVLLLSGSSQTLRLLCYLQNRIVGDTHKKGLLVTNLV